MRHGPRAAAAPPRDLAPGPLWGPTVIRLSAVALLILGIAVMRIGSSAPTVHSARPVWAFVPTWDQAAIDSLRLNGPQVSVALPTGLTLAPASASGIVDHLPKGIEGLVAQQGARIEPVVSNATGSGFDGALAGRMLRSATARGRVVATLAAAAAHRGWDGVNVDFEALPARDRNLLVMFVAELGHALGPGRDVSVDVPALPSPDIALGALGRVAGHVIVMAYDQHADAGGPGPITSPAFAEAAYRTTRAQVPASRIVLGLPTYGYDWAGRRPPNALGFYDAMTLAAHQHVVPVWSAAGGSTSFTFTQGRTRHHVWFSDAASLAAEMRTALPSGQPVGLWRLGTEDPGIWPVLASPRLNDAALRNALDPIPPSPTIAVVGSGGDVVHAVMGDDGHRTLLSGGGESFRELPDPYQLLRSPATGRRVALTFDDGPTARWTPQVLDELGRLHVPATFFVVGENAAANPGLVRREAASGYIVGDHTFTHPNLSVASPTRTRIEIEATARVIAGLTGRRPLFLRAPYEADSTPTNPAEIAGIIQAQHLGYTAINASVDSFDYLRPTPDRIVRNVLHSLADGDGNIILMHDGGGDRSRTVAAIPKLVTALRARGYRLVSVPDLIGLSPSRAMQPVAGANLWLSRMVAWTLVGWFAMTRWVSFIGFLLIGLVALRSVVIIALALRNRRRQPVPSGRALPSVTVLVPAYNEEEVIERTVRSLIDQEGITPEIIVIDDGSRDATADRAERLGVRVLRQMNAGKWSALNRGLTAATGDVIVAIDADTVIERHAVRRLAERFDDPAIGAVSGTAKVGNRHTLITLWQHIEYVTSFNLDRRAYSDLNAITVVPGAIGAWRRTALLEVGGYSGRTLAEDCDLTVSLIRAGWKVVYEPSAVAFTEAPETARGLARQRLRWTFGTFQVLWLNRSALMRPREGALGMVALPYAWLYQTVMSLLGPLIDILVLIALVSGGFGVVVWWFLLATLIEMVVSFLAFRMEGERGWPVLVMPLQRFMYRQLMYWVAIRSLLRALNGRRMEWGKLARTGTVRAEGETT